MWVRWNLPSGTGPRDTTVSLIDGWLLWPVAYITFRQPAVNTFQSKRVHFWYVEKNGGHLWTSCMDRNIWDQWPLLTTGSAWRFLVTKRHPLITLTGAITKRTCCRGNVAFPCCMWTVEGVDNWKHFWKNKYYNPQLPLIICISRYAFPPFIQETFIRHDMVREKQLNNKHQE